MPAEHSNDVFSFTSLRISLAKTAPIANLISDDSMLSEFPQDSSQDCTEQPTVRDKKTKCHDTQNFTTY